MELRLLRIFICIRQSRSMLQNGHIFNFDGMTKDKNGAKAAQLQTEDRDAFFRVMENALAGQTQILWTWNNVTHKAMPESLQQVRALPSLTWTSSAD